MIIAIDQGSSKTQVLVGDECGTIYGVGKAEGACHFLVGMEIAMHSVKTATDAALQMAGFSWEKIDKVCAGMSGANWPEEFEMLHGGLAKLFHVSDVKVYNDCVAALYAGARSGNAVVLCAGTAFNAAVLKEHQLVWIYNNYIEKSNEGGKSLGERALQSVFRAETHMGEATSLTKRALDFFGYDDLLSLVIDFDRDILPRRVKDFAMVVDEEAMRGDRVALEVQYKFAVSISRYATAALERFDMLGCQSEVVMTGGVFKAKSPLMADTIRAQVHRRAPQTQIVESKYEPVIGAYRLALDPASETIWWKNIEKSAEELSLLRFGKERIYHA